MKNSKLIEVLSSFNKEEWILFKKHILTCTFEKSEIYRLFLVLQTNKNKLVQFTDMNTFRLKYFPYLTIKALSNLMSKLYRITESWLSINEMKTSKYDEEIYLLKSLNKKGLFNQANSVVKKIEKKINKDKTINIETSKSLTQLYYSQYYSNNPEGKNQLTNLIKWHCTYYQETSFLYEIELVNWGGIARTVFHKEIELLENTTNSIDPSKLSKLLHSLKLIYLDDDLNAFEEIVNALLTGKFDYGSELHLTVTNYMETLSRKLFMKGLLKDVKVVTKVQTYSLEVSASLDEGRISSARFQNIVATLSYMNTYDWTQKFIDKWIGKVTTKNRQMNKDLAYAQNCFYHNNFDKIIKYIVHNTYDDINQKTRALSLQLISLYYTRDDDYDSFFSEYINLKSILSRNKTKLGVSTYNGVRNLVTQINNLDKGQLDKVKEAIKTNQNILYRSWIENQVK